MRNLFSPRLIVQFSVAFLLQLAIISIVVFVTLSVIQQNHVFSVPNALKLDIGEWHIYVLQLLGAIWAARKVSNGWAWGAPLAILGLAANFVLIALLAMWLASASP